MNKFVTLLLSFFPILASADTGSLSFAPPPSDYSVVFLGNIFGIVDGVLHGNGSQIMGSMFGVFNAAVLALGGIVIMYTLLVSTMNTAQEGQMLGQKWSSIWIPVRSTMGLALLIPKASGYCLMQIFVMWVVVQGVGAADKVWNAALSYLNRGGAIVQGQMQDPTKALLSSSTPSQHVAQGAAVIFAGEVCMLGLQKQLETMLQTIKSDSSTCPTGGTRPAASGPAQNIYDFCNSSVPDFLASVDPVTIQNTTKPNSKNLYTAEMPNFDTTSWPLYSQFNHLCGTIHWSPLDVSQAVNAMNENGQSDSDKSVMQMSRAIAIQQMYTDLGVVAQTIVNNDTYITPNSNSNNGLLNQVSRATAVTPFGLPYDSDGHTVCSDNSDSNCMLWMPPPDASSALLNGTEFVSAINDYNGVMYPTLNLIEQAKDAQGSKNAKSFIQSATQQGWIMAGSYFFNLVMLNAESTEFSSSNPVDNSSGLENSIFFDPNILFDGSTGNIVYQLFQPNAQTINGSLDQVNNIAALICAASGSGSGSGSSSCSITTSTILASSHPVINVSPNASTVYGYINNATILRSPGQPGMAPLQFANMVSMPINTSVYSLPWANMPCGGMDLGLVTPCVGRLFGDLFYNMIFRYMFNIFLTLVNQFINQTIMAFLMIPLVGIASIFQEGIYILDTPGVNPIVALANLGTYYINFASNFWLYAIEASIVAILVPLFGIFVLPIILLSMPLLLTWIGIMLQIGFTTAYYVPILPYSIFLFGSIAWLMAVIEAMVAAPIVALGVTHPEGHDAFGKGEQAIMILMNVFLRPAMMIIGYISGIAMCYVSVWILNAGFDNAIGFIQGGSQFGTGSDHGGSSVGEFLATPGSLNGAGPGVGSSADWTWGNPFSRNNATIMTAGAGATTGGYTAWAGLYAYFFSILVYTMLYLTVVQKSFTLISALPDKVLRWIGGQQENAGAESAQWGQEVQSKVSESGKETGGAQAQIGKRLGGESMNKASESKATEGTSAEASGAAGG